MWPLVRPTFSRAHLVGEHLLYLVACFQYVPQITPVVELAIATLNDPSMRLLVCCPVGEYLLNLVACLDQVGPR
eukprot:COSAG06_NODE_1959_length_7980_cov_19.961426_1_plen_74_part_00